MSFCCCLSDLVLFSLLFFSFFSYMVYINGWKGFNSPLEYVIHTYIRSFTGLSMEEMALDEPLGS